MSDELPTAWRVHTDRKGISSYRRLGTAASISHETARRVVRGSKVRRDSVQAVADALGLDVEEVYALRNEVAPDFSQDWTPPASSASLTHEEREALSRLIALMTAGRRAGEEHAGGSAPTKAAAGAAAQSESPGSVVTPSPSVAALRAEASRRQRSRPHGRSQG